jgi:hypothetical protein
MEKNEKGKLITENIMKNWKVQRKRKGERTKFVKERHNTKGNHGHGDNSQYNQLNG